jgi:hypothetical protein
MPTHGLPRGNWGWGCRAGGRGIPCARGRVGSGLRRRAYQSGRATREKFPMGAGRGARGFGRAVLGKRLEMIDTRLNYFQFHIIFFKIKSVYIDNGPVRLSYSKSYFFSKRIVFFLLQQISKHYF